MTRTVICTLATIGMLAAGSLAEAGSDEVAPGLRRLDVPPEPESSPDPGIRDPFRPYLKQPRVTKPVLERVPLASLRLRAMVWDVQEPKAVVALNGAEHVIGVDTKVGREGGIVTQIDGTCVVVEQSFTEQPAPPETVRLCLHFPTAS